MRLYEVDIEVQSFLHEGHRAVSQRFSNATYPINLDFRATQQTVELEGK